MLIRKLEAKSKVLKISLNESCIFKKFAEQLMYALGPLSQSLKEFDNLLASEKLSQLNFCVNFKSSLEPFHLKNTGTGQILSEKIDSGHS